MESVFSKFFKENKMLDSYRCKKGVYFASCGAESFIFDYNSNKEDVKLAFNFDNGVLIDVHTIYPEDGFELPDPMSCDIFIAKAFK